MRRLQAVAGLVALALAGSAHVGAGSLPPGGYRVKAGDTLARIAKKSGVAVDTLAKANGIANPNHIRAGQVITVPKAAEPAAAGKAPPVTLPPLPSPYVLIDSSSQVHTVAAGETLARIAAHYGTTVAELSQANGLKNANMIRIGADLKIPGPAWLCPVNGPHQFTDSWGQPRDGGRRHEGVDIFAFRGTPVVAPVPGTVTHSQGAVAGNAFYLKGDDGNTYYGAHLDTLGAEGRAERGAVLGTVGDTGNARGGTPHLHFELKPGGGAPVDPFPTLQKWC
ncbi:MAG TPA: M23 family metallopeptidase [Dermatophilaceae bacterium]|nr:M23 family metallopeptidase [Dermatophilaceae bacterium]